MIAAGGASLPEADLSNLGGVTAWMKVAYLAEAYDLPVTTRGVRDLHVRLLAAVPNASLLEAHGFGLEASIRHPAGIDEAVVTAPEQAGHGIGRHWDRRPAKGPGRRPERAAAEPGFAVALRAPRGPAQRRESEKGKTLERQKHRGSKQIHRNFIALLIQGLAFLPINDLGLDLTAVLGSFTLAHGVSSMFLSRKRLN